MLQARTPAEVDAQGIYISYLNMLKRLHLRVFRTAVDSNFQLAFFNYHNERREFSPEDMAPETWRDNATKKVSSIIRT
jgi:hypothetical protein